MRTFSNALSRVIHRRRILRQRIILALLSSIVSPPSHWLSFTQSALGIYLCLAGVRCSIRCTVQFVIVLRMQMHKPLQIQYAIQLWNWNIGWSEWRASGSWCAMSERARSLHPFHANALLKNLYWLVTFNGPRTSIRFSLRHLGAY